MKNNSKEQLLAWLREFERNRGRPLRVLHLGNIANNAYLNAKALRRIGVHADVLCNDYYHIMGCPEWEDADIEGHWGDDFNPDWRAAGVRDFTRPEWFIQGPLNYCALLISQRFSENPVRRRVLRLLVSAWSLFQSPEIGVNLLRFCNVWYRLKRELRLLPRFLLAPFFLVFLLLALIALGGILIVQSIVRALRWSLRPKAMADGHGRGTSSGSALWKSLLQRPISIGAGLGLGLARKIIALLDASSRKRGKRVDYLGQDVVKAFRSAWPDRVSLTAEDLEPYESMIPVFHRISGFYDIIHCYATKPLYPLLSGDRPFVAYEHGTLRNIPFQDDAVGKLTALSYREADHVFITNCDNRQAAERLGIERFSFIPHPVNEDGLDSQEGRRLYEVFHAEHDTDFVLLHPSRQHWSDERHPDWEKGNDHLIRGFAHFVREVDPRALAVFVEWGKSVEESRALIDELGITNRVIWIPPQSNRAFVRYIQSSDVVADQFHLGAFGSLTPKAMAYGKPVLLYLDEDQHSWAFPEMPPVENVRTADQIAAALQRLHGDRNYRVQKEQACREWYWKYHSMDRVVHEMVRVYRRLLVGQEQGNPGEGG